MLPYIDKFMMSGRFLLCHQAPGVRCFCDFFFVFDLFFVKPVSCVLFRDKYLVPGNEYLVPDNKQPGTYLVTNTWHVATNTWKQVLLSLYLVPCHKTTWYLAWYLVSYMYSNSLQKSVRGIIEVRENVCFACTEEVIPSSTR